MRHVRLAAVAVLAILILSFPLEFVNGEPTRAVQTNDDRKEVKVWVNTNSGVYHCPGTRWYGKTREGKYMGECAAIKDGNRAAYGKACGSVCK